MAWPNTPLTTYVAGNPPAIKAADLNSMQDATNQTINGTYSVNSLTADETALPGTSRSPGLDCKGTRLWGWINFTGAGVAKRHYNGKTFVRNAVGDYTVEFYGAPADPDFCLVHGTAIAAGAARIVTVKPYLSGGGVLALDIKIHDDTGAAADAAASVGVWAE